MEQEWESGILNSDQKKELIELLSSSLNIMVYCSSIDHPTEPELRVRFMGMEEDKPIKGKDLKVVHFRLPTV